MKITFSDDNSAFEDFTAWALVDKNIYKKILSLIKDIKRNPTDGIGKPEPLKGNLQGYWSRRIDEANRIVYKVEGTQLIIVQCGEHYCES
jgi:toxin YoeB